MRRKRERVGDRGPVLESGRITPDGIQRRVFRQTFRGYAEREVDQFLDDVTAELARQVSENRALREQLARVQIRPAGDLPEGHEEGTGRRYEP